MGSPAAAETDKICASAYKRWWPHKDLDIGQMSMKADKCTYGALSSDATVGEVIELDTVTNKSVWRFLEVKTDGPLETASFLYNSDLKPVDQEKRVWRWYNYVCFWVSDALNVNAWQIASTAVAAGLNWWQAWLSVWLGYFFASFFVVIMARPGTYYHIPFPVSVRSSFGISGSAWPVANRVFMAIIWFACQTWIFGQSIQLMVRAFYGNDIRYKLPSFLGKLSNSEVDQFEYVCYVAAWLITLPAIWFPPSSIRHLFTAKSIVVPIAGGFFLVWALQKAFDAPKLDAVPLALKAVQSNTSIKWKFIASTMNGLANFAAMIVNAPDFSRFADRPSAPTWSQFITIPCAFSVTALVGILVSTCSGRIYGTIYWSPLDVLDRFLDDEGTGTRIGVFLIAAALGLASIGTNICANSLSAGTDMSALVPRFINIRRGGYLCAIIAFALKPWEFFASSNKFTAYLGSYSTFLSCVAGIMASDYYLVRRGQLDLISLYSAKPHSTYMFGRLGINWRAYAAYVCGILPNLEGFLHVFGRPMSPVFGFVYRFNYFVGFIISGLSYAMFCSLSPVEGVPSEKGWQEENAYVDDFDAEMLENQLLHTSL